MSSRFDSLLLRGIFGAVLGLAAMVGAGTQAAGFRGELVLADGRVTLVPAPEPVIQCAMETQDESSLATSTARRGNG